MLKYIKFSFCLSHLSYQSPTLQALKPYNYPNSHLPQLFNFQHPTQPSMIQRMFQFNTKETPLLQLYLNYIQQKQATPQGIAYQFIQENLRTKVLSQLTKHKTQIKVSKAKVISSKLLEHTQFKGIFIHRKYNLNYDSYSVKTKRGNVILYEFKSSMRSEALRLYQKIVRDYQKDNMHEMYGKSMQEFGKQKSMNRYLYETVIDLQLKVSTDDGKELQLGESGPTKHILQIQSIFNPYSMEEFYLTDVDFILKGNPFFRPKVT